jgi:hypothetical protein
MMSSRRRSRRFDKAYLISIISDKNLHSEEWSHLVSFRSILDIEESELLDLLRELVNEGWLEEEEYQRTCPHCEQPLGLSYKYRLKEE